MKIILSISLVFLFFGCNSSIVDDPSTVIRFSVPESSHVKLYVENSYDTIVATLVDEVKQAGVYDVVFDNNNLAEGIYFYTLKMTSDSGNIIESTRRFLLLK
jgi:hypothetical protein